MKILLLFIFSLIFLNSIYTQNSEDSLVLYSDLKFHSTFEEEAFSNFVYHKTDTVNLFLAIDKTIGYENINEYQVYLDSLFELTEKINKQKNKKNIKKLYSLTKKLYLKKYESSGFFPLMFKTKRFNCVTSSILFALIFEKINIPYNILVTSNHVYIVANPGKNSIVIDPSFPISEKNTFNRQFKKHYIKYLNDTKSINKEDSNSKSLDSKYEQLIKKSVKADFNELPGIQYYNMAFERIIENDLDEAFKLSQKAYYFFPDEQAEILLYAVTMLRLKTCTFEKTEDIDLLIQLSRFENIDPKFVSALMFKVIEDKMQFFENEEFCDSIYNRFIEKCYSNKIKKEIRFNYNIQLYAYNKKFGDSEKYLFNALSFKPENEIALDYFKRYLQSNFDKVRNNKKLLDSLISLENRFQHDSIKKYIQVYKNIAYLKITKEHYEKNNVKEANKYLELFKESFSRQLKNMTLEKEIETTYRKIALYYYYKNNITKMEEYLSEGLKYVPNSKLLLQIQKQ